MKHYKLKEISSAAIIKSNVTAINTAAIQLAYMHEAHLVYDCLPDIDEMVVQVSQELTQDLGGALGCEAEYLSDDNYIDVYNALCLSINNTPVLLSAENLALQHEEHTDA